MTGQRPASVLLGVIALVACATRPHEPAAEQLGASAQNVLVLPLNVALTLPTELEASSDRVWDTLVRYVQDHGKRVQTVRLVDARKLWLDSTRRTVAAKGAGEVGFHDVARALVLELRQETEFDAVIMPSLFIQQARLSAKRASWDGVSRPVEIGDDVRSVGSIMTETYLSGTTPAASLHVAVLDAEGTVVHEARAGLALVLRMAVRGNRGARIEERRVEWELRPDLFQNEADVREGIENALDPFLAPPAE